MEFDSVWRLRLGNDPPFHRKYGFSIEVIDLGHHLRVLDHNLREPFAIAQNEKGQVFQLAQMMQPTCEPNALSDVLGKLRRPNPFHVTPPNIKRLLVLRTRKALVVPPQFVAFSGRCATLRLDNGSQPVGLNRIVQSHTQEGLHRSWMPPSQWRWLSAIQGVLLLCSVNALSLLYGQ